MEHADTLAHVHLAHARTHVFLRAGAGRTRVRVYFFFPGVDSDFLGALVGRFRRR